MRRDRLKDCFAAVLAVLGLFNGSIHASTVASMKAMGMGGAAVAYGQDTITNFYNPANALSMSCRTDIGAATTFNHRVLDLSDRPSGFQSGSFRAIRTWDMYGEGGWNTPWDCCGSWAFAVQWNNYDQFHVHYPMRLSDFSGFTDTLDPAGSPLKFNYRTDVLSTTAAYGICSWLTFGAAANVYFSWLNITGLEQLINLSAHPFNVTNRTTDSAEGVGVTIGALGKFWCDCIAVGLTYSPRVHMTKFDKYEGFLPDASIDIPETYRLGVSLSLPSPCKAQIVIAADAEYRRYSQIPTWANNFPGNSPRAFSPLFGTFNGPGFGWDDQWIAKVGVNYRLNQYWALRGGYRHEKSPIPRNGGTNTALNTLTLNTIEDYVSVGFTIYPDCMSEVTAFGQYGFNKNIKSAYPNINEDVDWASGNVRFQAYTISAGVGYALNF